MSEYEGGELMEGGFGTRDGAKKNPWLAFLKRYAEVKGVKSHTVLKDPVHKDAVRRLYYAKHHGTAPPPVKKRAPPKLKYVHNGVRLPEPVPYGRKKKSTPKLKLKVVDDGLPDAHLLLPPVLPKPPKKKREGKRQVKFELPAPPPPQEDVEFEVEPTEFPVQFATQPESLAFPEEEELPVLESNAADAERQVPGFEVAIEDANPGPVDVPVRRPARKRKAEEQPIDVNWDLGEEKGVVLKKEWPQLPASLGQAKRQNYLVQGLVAKFAKVLTPQQRAHFENQFRALGPKSAPAAYGFADEVLNQYGWKGQPVTNDQYGQLMALIKQRAESAGTTLDGSGFDDEDEEPLGPSTELPHFADAPAPARKKQKRGGSMWEKWRAADD